MAMNRRLLLQGIASAALYGTVRGAFAQDTYPSKPIRIIVPFAAGGLVDVLARIAGERLQARWRQPVIVENRLGASGNLGAEMVAKAAPDGYTLLFAPPPPLAVNHRLFKKLGFDPDAFVAVSVMAAVPNILVVNQNVAATTVQGLIEFAKKNPDKLSYASTGSGGTPHLTAELFKRTAGIGVVHVPYRGMPPALADLIGGQVDMMFANLADALPHIKAGKLKAIAVASKARFPGLSDTPTIDEALPGFVSDTWYALVAPPKTPLAIAKQLSTAISEALATPELKDRLAGMSAIPVGSSPDDSAIFIRRESARWGDVIVAAGIKPE